MKITNQIFPEERALYKTIDTTIENCRFEGKEDGESALKESRNIEVNNCFFALRYPFWHVNQATINNIEMTETCRAAFWYDKNISLINSKLFGIKAIRECFDIKISNSTIVSPEFGWMSHSIDIYDTEITSEYAFLSSTQLQLDHIKFYGKYSFQYVQNCTIRDSYLDTKDAFWHSKNITVYNSTIKGEYLGWYSENLKLINCKIIGTQPLCYTKGLVLIDCEMIDTDLSFEYSEVNAEIIGNIISIKNPLSGKIIADNIQEIILDDADIDTEDCQIIIR